jgi:Cu-Zn family superoxide dismutase
MRGISWAFLPVVAAACAAGCTSDEGAKSAPVQEARVEAAPSAGAFAGITEAVAAVGPVGKSHVHGVVRFSQAEDGVKIVADIEGLKPDSKHAFHIHEFGDVTGAGTDGKSAGGHYNPEHVDHGGPDSAPHHAGDLGNLSADAHGVAHLERVIHGITIAGDHDAILGRSVIIHAGEDDFATQPTGTTGDGATRIACGVIGVAKTPGK